MFRIKKEDKWIKTILAVIITLFFVGNLWAALKYGPFNYLGNFEKFNNDDVKYIRSGWELAENGHFIYQNTDEPTVFIMPGLTYGIAFFVKLFGRFGGVTAFRVFQVFLQTGSMYLLFLIGRKIFNSKAALLGCLLNFFYVAEYYVTTIILTEVLFKFFLLLLVYVSLYAIEQKKLVYYTIGGIIWGFSCLVRPTIAVYPVVILFIWIFYKYSLRDMIKFTTFTILVFSLVMCPWWVRNYQVFHRFIPLTLSSGNPFLQGTYVNYNQEDNYTPYKVGKTMIETNQNEMNAGLYRLKTYASKEPLKYIGWYTYGKAWLLWNLPFYWKEVFGIEIVRAAIYHHIILIIAIFESILLLKRRYREFLPLFAIVLFFTIIYLPYFAMSRYTYPSMSLVCITAGYGIYEVMRRFKFEQTTNFDS